MEAFRARAEDVGFFADSEGIGYQALVNQALRTFMESGKPPDEVALRRIIREETQAAKLPMAA